MNKLIYLLFLSIFLLDHLAFKIGFLNRYVTWLPDIISILLALIISIRITTGYGKNIPAVCSIFLVLFISNIIIGAVINFVPPGPIIAGTRTYLKFIPLFILPFVFSFSNQQIYTQLRFLLVLSIMQAPFALYQRLVLSRGYLTGDLVRGTLPTSGILTTFLACAIAILMTFYLAKKISLKSFLFVFLLIFMPMTMNETKSTVLLLPLAVLLPIFFSSSGIKLKQFIPMIILGIFVGIAFIFIYNHFSGAKYEIGEFFSSDTGKAEHYLFRGVELGVAGTEYGKIGRIDSILLAYQVLSENILTLLFGLGLGNVSESFSPALSGQYAEAYSSFNVKFTQVTLILWELGIFGVLLYFALISMTFKYSRRLSKYDSFPGIISSGWSVVCVIMAISLLYKPVLNTNVLGYLFWYFSGYVISEHFKNNSNRNEYIE
jgi:hypothetical protein